MQFSSIVGQEFIKNHLTTSVDAGRIAHAQLFIGPSGVGVLPMAIAYAQYILCSNTGSENLNGNQACNLKFESLSHPDLHFAFPVAINGDVKKNPVSNLFMNDWRSFVQENPYGDLYEWHQHIGIEKKQGQIGVNEASEINKSLSLKAYEGGYKVMIIWGIDKMHTSASNKLLKLLEEPPEKTLFLLLSESEDGIIDTIKSRCQVLHFPKLSEPQIAQALETNYPVPVSIANKIAHQAQGDYNKAIHLLNQDGDDIEFEKWFVSWVRTAFQAKRKKDAILDLMQWSETIAKSGRETQKNFLEFCVQIFRQALLKNYKANDLVFMEMETGFELSKFAPFIHNNNIFPIVEAVQEASYHIERNGNAKIIFTDLSIKLTKLLHTKS
ncbi:ATP-binding protein [Dokdonia sp. Hel_I_53]|uniref:DNA polymerase III subunit n=1 Tax=Dokdonia sp. Hel_I_53 TaxID=1566287 RepID=UPI00119BEC65|nr:DNA polymerase III subunit delta' [Dokdonia sp. Hel_I_53]TVZ52652.1 DNA polymerase-3 subunit delta' [Dokdonia sp. Hel_I_53]